MPVHLGTLARENHSGRVTEFNNPRALHPIPELQFIPVVNRRFHRSSAEENRPFTLDGMLCFHPRSCLCWQLQRG